MLDMSLFLAHSNQWIALTTYFNPRFQGNGLVLGYEEFPLFDLVALQC